MESKEKERKNSGKFHCDHNGGNWNASFGEIFGKITRFGIENWEKQTKNQLNVKSCMNMTDIFYFSFQKFFVFCLFNKKTFFSTLQKFSFNLLSDAMLDLVQFFWLFSHSLSYVIRSDRFFDALSSLLTSCPIFQCLTTKKKFSFKIVSLTISFWKTLVIKFRNRKMMNTMLREWEEVKVFSLVNWHGDQSNDEHNKITKLCEIIGFWNSISS